VFIYTCVYFQPFGRVPVLLESLPCRSMPSESTGLCMYVCLILRAHPVFHVDLEADNLCMYVCMYSPPRLPWPQELLVYLYMFTYTHTYTHIESGSTQHL
jgi:hypothetical protein